MQGFFEVKPQKVTKKVSCVSCGLYKNSKHPKMLYSGEGRKGILCVGEFPDDLDDEKDQFFTGVKGHILKRLLDAHDIDLEIDCVSTYALGCLVNNPTDKQIVCCRSKLFACIKEVKPKLILLFGEVALNSFLAHKWNNEKTPSLEQMRGFVVPDRDVKCWVMATYSLDFIEKSEVEVRTLVKQDIAKAMKHLSKKFPVFIDEASQVEIVEDLSFLRKIKEPTAFDYETTGLKPHDISKHKIICMSVCDAPDKVRVFMMPKGKQLEYVKEFLTSDVPKLGQNIKFEHSWSKNKLKVNVRKWTWDAMLVSHILDNRRGITGLKFQSYVRYGILDYSSHIKQYFKSKDEKNGNGVNRIEELIKTESGKRDLLIYCGIDSLLERRLCIDQMKEVNNGN